jgi:hypothetical protein
MTKNFYEIGFENERCTKQFHIWLVNKILNGFESLSARNGEEKISSIPGI